MKQENITVLSKRLVKEIDCSCESTENMISRFEIVIEQFNKENDLDYHELKNDDLISTYGGESIIDDFEFSEYGIQLGDVSIGEISPKQMITLAKIIVDHLLINGHKFEIKKTYEQDQRERLICLDKD